MDTEQEIVKIQKRFKVLGILMLIGVIFRIGLLLFLHFSRFYQLIGECDMPTRTVLSFLNIVLVVLFVVVSVRMIKGRVMGIKKYLISIIVLGVLFIPFTFFNVMVGLEMILPIITLISFSKAMKNEEYVKTLSKESKLERIFSIILLVLFVVGLMYCLYTDITSIRLSRECWNEFYY